MIEMSVVLPQPEGPMSMVSCPGSASKRSPFSTCCRTPADSNDRSNCSQCTPSRVDAMDQFLNTMAGSAVSTRRIERKQLATTMR
jgi:hypothetical protein